MATRQQIHNMLNINLDNAEQHPGRCKPHKNTYYINGTFAIVKLQHDNYMICSTDEHTLYLLDKYVWYAQPNGYIYTNGCTSYFHIKYYELRQGVINVGNCIDHINRIRYDNRNNNIRQCTYAENNKNKTIRQTNKTGKQGVFLYKNRWYASIKVGGIVFTKSYTIKNPQSKQMAINKRLEYERLFNFIGD